MSKLQRIKDEIQSIWDTVDAEDRPTTPGERAKVNRLVQEAESEHLKVRVKAFDRFMGGDDLRGAGGLDMGFTEGPGDTFIKSKGWQEVADPSHRGQRWSSGPVDVSFNTKGTLLEGPGSPGTGSGGGWLTTPQVVPGAVQTLYAPLTVEAAFASASANGNTVRYMVEGLGGTIGSGVVNAAAGVAEAGVKPESTLNMSVLDEPVKKVATTLALSDEMADDSSALQSYINSRLSLFVQIEAERQILRGGGTNELVGLVSRTGVNTYSKLGTDDNATSLARVISNTRGSSFLEPTHVVMHPTNWLSTRLLRDGTGGTVGNFYGAGPFGASYGGNVPTGLFGATLWDKPVILSNVVGAGTAIVGSFTQGAQLYNRGGPVVEVTNSHSDWFTKDLIAVRCERRLALCVYRPSSFTVVSGLA
jgi:HK97 family phage major capsid protein